MPVTIEVLVGDDTFRQQLGFASSLANKLNISAATSHLAIIQYAEKPQLEIALNQFTNPSQVTNIITVILTSIA